MKKKILALVLSCLMLVSLLMVGGVSVSAAWAPDLSENATEVNYDMPKLPLKEAPYSYGFSGAGNPNQNSAPSATRASDVEVVGSTHVWMVTAGYTGVTRYVFDTNAAEDFTFTIRVRTKDVASLADKVRVYACEGFTGGYYGGIKGETAHQVEPATPTNPTNLTIAFENAPVQPTRDTWTNICVVADGDIPASAVNLYLELEGLGDGWEIGLLDFDYVSDPIVIVPLPDFADPKNLEEMFEDLGSSRLTVDMDGQALSITNLKRVSQMFGTFNEADNMLIRPNADSEGSVVYKYDGVSLIDVRGWIKDTMKDKLPVTIEVSADGKTWKKVQPTARWSAMYNQFSTFSLLVDKVDKGMNYVKVTLGTAVANDMVSLSDVQILYAGAPATTTTTTKPTTQSTKPTTGAAATTGTTAATNADTTTSADTTTTTGADVGDDGGNDDGWNDDGWNDDGNVDDGGNDDGSADVDGEVVLEYYDESEHWAVWVIAVCVAVVLAAAAGAGLVYMRKNKSDAE